MKHLFIFLIISLSSLLLIGCLRTYYPAVYHSSAPAMISETNNDPEFYSNYLGGDFTVGQGSYENETLQMMKVNYLIVNTQDHTNFNLEGFGYTGNYKVSGLDINYDGYKNFIGLGTDLKFNINFKFGKVKVGTGLNLGLGVEFGEYYEFRKSAEQAHIIDDENSLLFILFSGSPFISYEFTESTILSLQLNSGLPGVISPSLILNHDNVSYWLCWLPDKNISDNYYGQRITFGVMIGLQDSHLNF